MGIERVRFRVVLALTVAIGSLVFGGCAEVIDPSAAARRVTSESCSGCHSASMALNWKAPTSKLANDLIDRMVGHGATVTPAERAILVAHFLL